MSSFNFVFTAIGGLKRENIVVLKLDVLDFNSHFDAVRKVQQRFGKVGLFLTQQNLSDINQQDDNFVTVHCLSEIVALMKSFHVIFKLAFCSFACM